MSDRLKTYHRLHAKRTRGAAMVAATLVVLIVLGTGCESKSPYIQKKSWLPFTQAEPSGPPATGENQVARAQNGSTNATVPNSSDVWIYGAESPSHPPSDSQKTVSAYTGSYSATPPTTTATTSQPTATPPTYVAAAPSLPSVYPPLPDPSPSFSAPPPPTPLPEIPQPPEMIDFPAFAQNAYDALERRDDEPEPGDFDPKTGRTTPPRERESLVDKERAEREMEEKYRVWLAEQQVAKKENAKMPRYLQPLANDHEVFENPNSPFARQMQAASEKEHTFIRQVTAADLNMMSDVSSPTELMDWEKEQDGVTDWSKYSGKSLYNKWRDFLGMGPSEREAHELMKKACLEQIEYEKTKEVKKLREAAKLYARAAKKWPESLLEEDALFYAGECSFFAKDYTQSKVYYKALVTKFSNSVLKRDACERLYYLGCYWLQCSEEDPTFLRLQGGERPRFSDFAGSKDAFETIFMNDVSDSGRASDALFALANGYMRRGIEQGDASFESAAKYYQQLYEFYPASKHVDKAYQLAMLALYQSYRGPMYDNTPLKKAMEIAEAAKKAGKGDRDVIVEQLRLIREEQARYLLTRGEYYEKKEVYASARSFYNRLVEEYPESQYAAGAATRYQRIADHPAETDQFSYIRPILPFIPKSDAQYYENFPTAGIESAIAGGRTRPKNPNEPDVDFTALEKSTTDTTKKPK